MQDKGDIYARCEIITQYLSGKEGTLVNREKIYSIHFPHKIISAFILGSAGLSLGTLIGFTYTQLESVTTQFQNNSGGTSNTSVTLFAVLNENLFDVDIFIYSNLKSIVSVDNSSRQMEYSFVVFYNDDFSVT